MAVSNTPTKRRYYGFLPNSKRQRINTIHKYLIGCGRRAPRINPREIRDCNRAAKTPEIAAKSALINTLPMPQLRSPVTAAEEVTRGTSQRKYPPPRSLSSINFSVKRDFPANCGRQNNVPSLRNSVSDNGKVVDECKSLDVAVVTDGKAGKDDKEVRLPYAKVVSKELIVSARDKECENVSSKDLVVLCEDYVSHNKVKEAVNLFQELFAKLSREREKSGIRKGGSSGVFTAAAALLQKQQKWVNTTRRLGTVPGVEVGDRFQCRAELVVIGLHFQLFGGIDYMKKDGQFLATSIVDSGRYANDMKSSDVLIYSGQGGNPSVGNKRPRDQKLERGNLALKNSMEAKTPVRVIRGFKSIKLSTISGTVYAYDGLYLVDKYWQERGQFGKLVFKFLLKKFPVLQAKLTWEKVNKLEKPEVCNEGLCVDDISQGKEKLPIRAVNTIDDEKPPFFNYIKNIIYREFYECRMTSCCDCTNGCSNPKKCLCAMKNGGKIPFTYDGRIVKAKPLIFECGPSCKCSFSCFNKVSQHGIQFQLEVFKTKSKGWGVRSCSYIPCGSFICEYIGEMLKDKVAEERVGRDEYLFDLGNNNDGAGFTIDAAQFGNVGRFVNHSCSPNLYTQNILYDHDRRRMPHIMLFAMEDIPPLQELTYDYNYKIGQVCDANGNIKMMNCNCGSPNCVGRLY